MTAPRFELTSQRQKVSRLPTETTGATRFVETTGTQVIPRHMQIMDANHGVDVTDVTVLIPHTRFGQTM